jgi:uroporphyrinogen III methyltransferase / synthase
VSASGRDTGAGGIGSTAARHVETDLANVSVLLARAGEAGQDLAEYLRGRGASVEVASVLKIEPPDESRELDPALESLDSYNYVVFTSANAVRAVQSRVTSLNLDPSTAIPKSVAVVGPATARAARHIGWEPSVEAPGGNSESLLVAMLGQRRGTVFLPQSDLADPSLQAGLVEAGFTVTRVVAYRTVPDRTGISRAAKLVRSGAVDVIVFNSPSTVHVLASVVACAHHQPLNVCVGSRTARACLDASLPVAATATLPSEAGVAEAIGLAVHHARA